MNNFLIPIVLPIIMVMAAACDIVPDGKEYELAPESAGGNSGNTRGLGDDPGGSVDDTETPDGASSDDEPAEDLAEDPEEIPVEVPLQFADVQNILTAACGGVACHQGGGLQDYVTDNSMLVVRKANVINRVGTLQDMPNPNERTLAPADRETLLEYLNTL